MGQCISNQQLRQVNVQSVPYFSFNGKSFYAKADVPYDGDTLTLCWMWKGEPIKYKCRCYGYDSPEMKPSLSNPNRIREKELAQLAKIRLTELVMSSPNGLVWVECGAFDKYGRVLVTLYSDPSLLFSKSINQLMIDEGHGKPYFGGTKEQSTIV